MSFIDVINPPDLLNESYFELNEQGAQAFLNDDFAIFSQDWGAPLRLERQESIEPLARPGASRIAVR